MDYYDLFVTLEELLMGVLETGEPAIIVIRFSSVLIFNHTAVFEVRNRVILKINLLLVSQICQISSVQKGCLCMLRELPFMGEN
jgi:hypothetical protein